MEIVLRKIPDTIGQVEIVEIDGEDDRFPASDEEAALGTAARIKGAKPDIFDVIFEDGC